MPGIAGCIRLSGTQGFQPNLSEHLAKPLVHETSYSQQVVLSEPAAVVVLVAPQLSFPSIDAAHDSAAGITVAVYGELFCDSSPVAVQMGAARRLLELYREQGDRLAELLDGSFVVFVRDRESCVLFNDYCGSRPVYWAEQDGDCYFSPEPKGIALLPDRIERTGPTSPSAFACRRGAGVPAGAETRRSPLSFFGASAVITDRH